MATMVFAMPEFMSTVPSTRMRSNACKSFETPDRGSKREGGREGKKEGRKQGGKEARKEGSKKGKVANMKEMY